MKKLMVVLGAVALAMGVQASQCNWKFKFGASEIGKNVYAVSASALSGKDLANLAFEDVTGNAFAWTSADGSKSGIANEVISKSTYAVTDWTVLADSKLTATTSKDLLLIFVDGDKYAIANQASPIDASGYLYNPGETGSNLSYTNQSAFTYTSFASGDVPEPTSAMLLLLGVAGLALKRKQA